MRRLVSEEAKLAPRGLLRVIALIIAFICPASAQDFGYDVEIDAPAAHVKLLREHLEIMKWRSNPRMTIEQLRRIFRNTPEEVRDLMATQGYFSPQIDSSLTQRNGRWLARLNIIPGEPARVGRVDIQFTGAISGDRTEDVRMSRLRAGWGLPQGAVFQQEAWEVAKREILKELIIRRYPAATIADSVARVNPQAREVALEVVVDSGPPFTFGELQVSGLERYPKSVIEKLNPIEPGAPYNQEDLVTFQTRLQDSGYFSSAFVTSEADPSRPDRVPVNISVTEFASQKVSFGVGFSTNTGARVQVDYQNLDFLDRTWRFDTGLKLETKLQSARAEVTLPLTPEDYRYSFGTRIEQTDIQDERTKKLSLAATRSRSRGKVETAWSLQYLTEDQEITNIPTERNRALFLNYSWTIRNLDNLIDPRRGYSLNWQLGGASASLLSEQDFIRGYAKAASFHPIGERDTLELRAELGAVASSTRIGIPTDYLWRTGGDNSIRGYSYQSIGVERGEAVVGGRYLGVASAEYVHRFSEKWGIALFYDVGDATDELSDFEPVQGVGVGARYLSPVGPIGIDLAYGIDKEQFRLHFAIGFAF
jgi:translocation and assembly module TamA